MAKRKDPAVLVVRYFETADIGQATLVLALAKDALNRRKPPKETTARAPRSGKRAGQPAPATVAPPPPPPTPRLAGA